MDHPWPYDHSWLHWGGDTCLNQVSGFCLLGRWDRDTETIRLFQALAFGKQWKAEPGAATSGPDTCRWQRKLVFREREKNKAGMRNEAVILQRTELLPCPNPLRFLLPALLCAHCQPRQGLLLTSQAIDFLRIALGAEATHPHGELETHGSFESLYTPPLPCPRAVSTDRVCKYKSPALLLEAKPTLRSHLYP